MLQQMLAEDKADMVREAVIQSLGIIMGYIDDADKYAQVRSNWEKVTESPEGFTFLHHLPVLVLPPFPAGFRADAALAGRPLRAGGERRPSGFHPRLRRLDHRAWLAAHGAHPLAAGAHREAAVGEAPRVYTPHATPPPNSSLQSKLGGRPLPKQRAARFRAVMLSLFECLEDAAQRNQC